MVWTRLPLDFSTPDKCGIAIADIDETQLAVKERIDFLKAVTPNDSFTNGFIHANRWRQTSATYAAVETGGKLSCPLPNNDIPQYATPGIQTQVLTRATWQLSGDFDFRVDWSFAPAVNSIYRLFQVSFSNGNYVYMGRYRDGAGNNVYFHIGTLHAGVTTATVATNGAFKIIRVGNKLTFYCDGASIGDVTDAGYGGQVVSVALAQRTDTARTAGWGGQACTFDNFTVSGGIIDWYRQDAVNDTLAGVSLTTAIIGNNVWPVDCINSYRVALESIIPYFFTDASGTARYTKVNCLIASFGQQNWQNEPNTPVLGDSLPGYTYDAFAAHLNDIKTTCDETIYLPDDAEAVDGFDEVPFMYKE